MAQIDQIRNQVQKLARSLREEILLVTTNENVEIGHPTVFLYSPNYRDRPDVRELRRHHSRVSQLIKSYANRDVPQAMSLRSAEDLLSKITSEVLSKDSEAEFEAWLTSSFEEFKGQLDRPVGTWRIYSVVDGLKVSDESFRFGNVEFVEFDPSRVQLLLDEFSNAYSKERLHGFLSTSIEGSLVGRTVAIEQVPAFDSEAAKDKALSNLQLTIDVLNVYADLIYNPGLMVRVDLPRASRYRASEKVLAIQIKPCIDLSMSHRSVGPIHPLVTSDLLSQPTEQLGVEKASTMLQKTVHSEVEGAILACMQWAGRATANERREEAFLLYAIALEALLAKKKDDFPITYRLRTRCAHLLASGLENRRQVSSEINRLYGIRSAIVHGGKYDVAESDLTSIRYITLNSILVILNDGRFSGFTKLDELNEWFNDQILLSD